MNFDASPRVPIFAVPHLYLSGNASEVAKRALRVDSARSTANIRLWSSYLPEDCVNAMITMGWDRTA
jgi:hypothetical protein